MILDEAFLLAKDAFNDTTHSEARVLLREAFPDASQEAVDEAYARAAALAHACYDFGDKCRLKWMTDDEALETMQTRFPGFSKTTYRNALGYGYLISR